MYHHELVWKPVRIRIVVVFPTGFLSGDRFIALGMFSVFNYENTITPYNMLIRGLPNFRKTNLLQGAI